jgi:hypothetical protein
MTFLGSCEVRYAVKLCTPPLTCPRAEGLLRTCLGPHPLGVLRGTRFALDETVSLALGAAPPFGPGYDCSDRPCASARWVGQALHFSLRGQENEKGKIAVACISR